MADLQSNTNTSSNSPTVQAEIDNFTKQINALLEKRSVLDAQVHQLLYTPSSQRSVDDNIRLSNLQVQVAVISSEITTLTQKESVAAATMPLNDIVNTTVKADTAQTTIPNIPVPVKGTVAIVNQSVDKNNLITYMTLTQHLNPYGRKRQCDTDLENVMAILNKYANNEVAETKEQITKLKALSQK